MEKRLSKRMTILLDKEFGSESMFKYYLRLLFLITIKARYKDFKYGKCFRVGMPLWLHKSKISLGDYCYLGPRANVNHELIVGDMVMISSDFRLVGNDHGAFEVGTPMRVAKPLSKPVTRISSEVWVGQGVTILSGVTVGKGSIIGANSLVNKDVAPYSIVAGVPARLIKKRFSVDEILEHENFLYEISE